MDCKEVMNNKVTPLIKRSETERLKTEGSGKMLDEDKPRNRNSGPPIFNAPTIVVWTIGALALSYIVLSLVNSPAVYKLERVAAVMPLRFLAGPESSGGVLGLLAPLFTHMLLHADLMHIGFNSIWLLAFGTPVARRLGAGAGRGILPASLFISFFALSGAAGALMYIAFNLKSTVLLVGASGGVFGLLGGLVRILVSRRSHFAKDPGHLVPLTDNRILIWSAVIIAVNFLMAFPGIGLMPGANSQIAWEAHLGGYLFGLLSFSLFDRLSRK